jgi:hypothetical protein
MKARTAARSAFEWITAVAIVLAVAWLSSDAARVWFGPIHTLVAEPERTTVHGVPGGATSVSLLVLLDGREIRTGLTHAQLESLLPPRQAVETPVMTSSPGGSRLLQAYSDSGRRFFVSCERNESTGTMQVAGIYLP